MFSTEYWYQVPNLSHQGLYQLLESKVTIRCRKQDFQMVQVSKLATPDESESGNNIGCRLNKDRWNVICVFRTQASIQRSIPVYKAAVKTNVEVRIDQENFISPDV